MENLFLSHSMSQEDSTIIHDIKQVTQNHGVELYLAENHPSPGTYLSEKVKVAIDACSAVIVLWTKAGAASSYVNQEIGYALGAKKPLVLMVEKGVPVKGFEAGKEYIEIDMEDPSKAKSELRHYLIKAVYDAQFQSVIIAIGFIVSAALIIRAVSKK